LGFVRVLEAPRGSAVPRARGGRRAGVTAGLLLLFFSLCSVALGSASSAARNPPPSVPKGAFAEGGYEGKQARVEGRLLIDHPDSEGQPIRVGVLFDLDPGWHLYWRNPGDTGLPTQLDWSVDGGFVGDLQWPTPTAYSESDGLFTTYGYEGRVLLRSDAVLDTDVVGPRYVEVEADFLVCETQCLPARFSLRRTLESARLGSAAAALEASIFDAWEKRVPVRPRDLDIEVEAVFSQSAIRPGDAFDAALLVRSCASGGRCTHYSVHAPPHVEPSAGSELSADLEPSAHSEPSAADARVHTSRPAFFPDLGEDFELGAGSISASAQQPGVQQLGFSGLRLADATASEARFRGVLSLTDPVGRPISMDVDLPMVLADAGADVVMLGRHWLGEAPVQSAAPIGSGLGLLEAILLALVGGLILNLMPCVLPVLAIKVFSVAELASHGRREVLLHGAAYTAGILASMGALAAVVLILQTAGTQVGWGFQFQSPVFVATVSLVVLVFALNLFGLFEIQVDVGRAASVGQAAVGPRKSFFEGLLAVVLATPCSAPFLGTAVGFAFASPPLVIVAIFLSIGLGLALPFVLVTLIPAWSHIIPRSGAWMGKLRASLGFALLATLIWLVSVMGGLVGISGMTTLMVLLLGVAFGAWIYGGVQFGERASLRWAVGASLLLLTGVGLNHIRTTAEPLASGAASAERTSSLGWTTWSPEATLEALDSGRPVLVIFSADWCITCKVNEKVVLADERVQDELERLDFEVLHADWTARDEQIRQELARFGRAGVPMYLVYRAGGGREPLVLPELLSVDGVLSSLRDAAPAYAALPRGS
jgi:thiol:disulfide interchange protein DsbD